MTDNGSALQTLLQSVTERAQSKSALGNNLRLLTSRCNALKDDADHIDREIEEVQGKLLEVERSNADLRTRCESLRRTIKNEISNKSSFRLTLTSLQQRHHSLERTVESKLRTQQVEIQTASDLRHRSCDLFSLMSEDSGAYAVARIIVSTAF